MRDYERRMREKEIQKVQVSRANRFLSFIVRLRITCQKQYGLDVLIFVTLLSRLFFCWSFHLFINSRRRLIFFLSRQQIFSSFFSPSPFLRHTDSTTLDFNELINVWIDEWMKASEKMTNMSRSFIINLNCPCKNTSLDEYSTKEELASLRNLPTRDRCWTICLSLQNRQISCWITENYGEHFRIVFGFFFAFVIVKKCQCFFLFFIESNQEIERKKRSILIVLFWKKRFFFFIIHNRWN